MDTSTDKEAMRQKLREKLKGKKLQRSSKDTKEKLLDDQLKKYGVTSEEVDAFKKQIAGLTPDALTKFLANKIKEVQNNM